MELKGPRLQLKRCLSLNIRHPLGHAADVIHKYTPGILLLLQESCGKAESSEEVKHDRLVLVLVFQGDSSSDCELQ